MKESILILAAAAIATIFFVVGRQLREPSPAPGGTAVGATPGRDLQEATSPLPPGFTFPDLGLVDREGNHFPLSSLYDGRPIYLLALAAGCRGCNSEIERWREEIAALPADVQVVGIAPESFEALDEAWGQDHPTFPVYRDANGILQAIGVEVVPSGFGLDATGQVVTADYGIESLPSSRLDAFRRRLEDTRQEHPPLRFETERARSR